MFHRVFLAFGKQYGQTKGEKKTNEEEKENLRGGYWKEKGIIKKVNEIKYSKTHKYAEKKMAIKHKLA